MHTAAVGADEDQSEEEDLENFSDISDNSDLFHVEAEATEVPRTDEDQEMAIVDTIVPHLREHPLLPLMAKNPTMKLAILRFAVVAVYHPCTAAFEVVDGHASASPKATGTWSGFCAFIWSRLIGARKWRVFPQTPGHGE